jgi:fucose permease
MVGLVFLTFLVISLLTNIMGPIIPDILRDFHVSLSAAGFLVFSFFIAYGIASIPAGLLVEIFHEKIVMMISFLAALVGAVSFALHPSYWVAVVSLFIIGTGMAMLQVAINPLLRVAGGEEHFAFNEVLAQLLFGSASLLSPLVYSYLVLRLAGRATNDSRLVALLRRLTPPALPWVAIYWIFALFAVAMLLVVFFTRFPRVLPVEGERPGTWQVYRGLGKRPVVWFYFFAIFCYVGCEQGTANWLSQFLSEYHGFDPHTSGAQAVSWFWGLMTLGCFAGVFLLKLFDSRRLLMAAAGAALITLSLALFGGGKVSLLAFPAMGLCCSVMWPIVISLALNSVAEHHGSFTGILATGITGGAIFTVVIGRLGDAIGLREGLSLLYLSFAFLFCVGLFAKPLINNATLAFKRPEISTIV